jgi:hypothetical protein
VGMTVGVGVKVGVDVNHSVCDAVTLCPAVLLTTQCQFAVRFVAGALEVPRAASSCFGSAHNSWS